MAIIEKVRNLNKGAYIIARTPLMHNIAQLYKSGADQVVPEKLEIAMDILNRVLVERNLPQKEINRVIKNARMNSLGVYSERDTINQPSIMDEFSEIRISQITVGDSSSAIGRSPVEIDLRKKTGVTLLALKRGSDVIEYPPPDTPFMKGDIAYVLGDRDQVQSAINLLGES